HDLITSDGTTLLGSDDKAGVAILMQLAEDLLADPSQPRPSIRLCFTIDEEIGRGVDKLDLEKLGASVAYTIDGSGTDTISTETFNAAEAVLKIDGVMVHPGYARDVMVNAARILATMLAALPTDRAPETTTDRQGYIHIHKIHEGNAAHAGATLILRDFEEAGLESFKQLLRDLVERYRAQHPRASFTLDIRDQYRNMRSYIAEKDERVVTFAYRAANEMGIDLTEELVRGGTDGSRLSEMGLPTPNVFNGGHDYHSCFEWNTVQNIERSLQYVKVLMEYWARHGGQN
ncbi:MAG TPA: tripeptide aminopeptidase PepT, partial [Rhodothermales bacterium]